MALRERMNVELFADYFQFYLWDAGAERASASDYTDADVRRRIKEAPGVVIVQPERNMTVPVVLEIHDREPPLELADWDHVAEASLYLPTGRLQVHECTAGVVAEFAAPPGWRRVRSQHAGLDTLSENGLEGDDHYLVAVWPAQPAPLRIVKQGYSDHRG